MQLNEGKDDRMKIWPGKGRKWYRGCQTKAPDHSISSTIGRGVLNASAEKEKGARHLSIGHTPLIYSFPPFSISQASRKGGKQYAELAFFLPTTFTVFSGTII